MVLAQLVMLIRVVDLIITRVEEAVMIEVLSEEV